MYYVISINHLLFKHLVEFERLIIRCHRFLSQCFLG